MKYIRYLIGVIACCSMVIILSIGFTTGYYSKRISRLVLRYQYECPMHLYDLWDITMLDAKNKDRFPEDLMFFTNVMPITQFEGRWRAHPLLCPCAAAVYDHERPDINSIGYAYIDWSDKGFAHITNVPGNYPLIYDSTLSNHSGRGVFVVKVNGNIIWDPGAQWINDFIKTHPEYQLSQLDTPTNSAMVPMNNKH